MPAYYNEIDPYVAQWLRNLIAENLIAPGHVDERSIVDVTPGDLAGYTQCHFFAGIGGWSRALRIADWPDGKPVWTGSCPCQPFSVAGSQGGFNDPRHLWPEFKRLIAQCRPSTVFGEQVAAASQWLNLVRSDLEEMDYAVGCIPIEAASAGAEHFRDRYWFVAHDDFKREGEEGLQRGREQCWTGVNPEDHLRSVANVSSQRIDRGQDPAKSSGRNGSKNDGSRALVYSEGFGWGEGWSEHEFRSRGFTAAVASIDDCQYVECPDGKWRRLPSPRVRWLGTRIPSRVAKLRALGNSIDPRPAAEFIRAYSQWAVTE